VQPPVMAKAKRPPPEKVCPECGKVVDARGMRNHIAWVHRGGGSRVEEGEVALGVVGWEAPAEVGG
jgi:hypothetical protein